MLLTFAGGVAIRVSDQSAASRCGPGSAARTQGLPWLPLLSRATRHGVTPLVPLVTNRGVVAAFSSQAGDLGGYADLC